MWNPEPRIAALREFSRRFNCPIVVTFSIDDGGQRFHVDSFGETKELCRVAAAIAGQIAARVEDGTLDPMIDGAVRAGTWVRENAVGPDEPPPAP